MRRRLIQLGLVCVTLLNIVPVRALFACSCTSSDGKTSCSANGCCTTTSGGGGICKDSPCSS